LTQKKYAGGNGKNQKPKNLARTDNIKVKKRAAKETILESGKGYLERQDSECQIGAIGFGGD